MARVVHPGPHNRAKVIEATLSRVEARASDRVEAITRRQAVCDAHEFPAADIAGVMGTCFFSSGDMMGLAVPLTWRGHPEGIDLIRRAFSLRYWGSELDRTEFETGGYPYSAPNRRVLQLFQLHGLAVAGGAYQVADRLAPYLRELIAAGAGDGLLWVDEPFKAFALHVLEAHVEQRWLDRVDVLALKGFAGILSALGDPARFEQALVDYCDFRLCNAWGFDSVDAPRRRHSSRYGSIFEEPDWDTLFPYELLSLGYAFEVATGRRVSLRAHHPILESPLVHLPQLWPAFEDDFIRRVVDLGQRTFGAKWQPLSGSYAR
jgi:hypothetical protein